MSGKLCGVATPCPECPFSRTSPAGRLGGSPPEKFIGQSVGPFVLPCHKHCDFSDPQWREKALHTPQCAGAAIFRANVGVASLMPPEIHALPANHELVFSDHAEFMAHHKRISVAEARMRLYNVTVEELLVKEFNSESLITYKDGERDGRRTTVIADEAEG